MIDRPKIRKLAKRINKDGTPGASTLDTAIVRQGVVQANGLDVATGLLTVLIGGSVTPVALPVIGWAPGDGEVCYIRSIGSESVVDGSVLQPNWDGPWRAPWGRKASAEVTSPDQNITTITDVAGLTCTWIAVANRRYLIATKMHFSNGSANIATNCTITTGTGATTLDSGRVVSTVAASGVGDMCNWEYEETGIAAGSVTRKVRAASASGTSTLRVSATQRAQLVVMDIGPATLGP